VIGIGRSVRVWARPCPTDLRKGYNGLYGLVQNELSRDPLSGDLFLFVNRKRNSCKVLLWDGTGLCISASASRRGASQSCGATTPTCSRSRRASCSSSSKDACCLRVSGCRPKRSCRNLLPIDDRHDLVRAMDVRNERDIEQLRRIALTQQTQIRHLLDELQRKCEQIDDLRGDTGELQRTIALLNELQTRADADKPAPKAKKGTKKRKQRGHGPKPQPKLERIEELFEVDDADKVCPECGGDLQPLAGEYESSEMVDVVEVSYRLVEVKRQKYVCRCGACVETAPGPERAIEGGRYSLPFAIKVALDKYVDHLPLTRQARIMKRWGLEVGSQTLWDQVLALGQLLRPCYDALYARILATRVIGLDQTSWKRLNKKGATPWQMWCLSSPEVIYHRICEDKSVQAWNDLLQGFTGVAVCDALSTHGAKECAKPGPALAGCWAHVFRRFDEAEPDFPQAGIAKAMIGELYEIDARGRDPAHRLELRQTESKAVLDRFEQWLLAQTSLKTTSLGQAIRYTYGYWPRLKLFVDDADIPLDNNRTERGIRGPVVGRKNHYGSKSKLGTEIAAIFYSLVETAKGCVSQPEQPGATHVGHAATALTRTRGDLRTMSIASSHRSLNASARI